ncbi:Mur ligase family protein [Halomonas tibetensis]|uniref:Mur ligase family protein n=1 Tax=Halomonas tibetensis TaxID=2259590 RepID=A0ABV7B514_9GAMM
MSSAIHLQINAWRTTPGGRHGVAWGTATFEFAGNLPRRDWQRLASAQRRLLAGYLHDTSLFDLTPEAWPAALCLPPEVPLADGARHWHPLGEWLLGWVGVIQRLAREVVGAGQIVSATSQGVRLAVPWQRESVAKGSVHWGLQHLVHALQGEFARAPTWQADFERWLDDQRQTGLSPNTQRFGLAACQRGMPVGHQPLGYLRVGLGSAARCLDSSYVATTSALSGRLARHKSATLERLARAGLPVPATRRVTREEQLAPVVKALGWPLAVKPADQDQGRGVACGITTLEQLRRAVAAAHTFTRQGVLVQRHVAGDDHRLLVVGGRCLAVARRMPGSVVGDGRHSVAVLVERLNADPRRGSGHRYLLKALSLDDEAQTLLVEQGLTPDAVPAVGQRVVLRRTANISSGGTAEALTRAAHPDNLRLAEHAARLVGLDVAGIDLLISDVRRSWREVGAAILEVNAQPGFRPHWLAEPGRDINGEVLAWLMNGEMGLIPTAVVTGTNGKTTVCHWLHHLWRQAGLCVGSATTTGVRIGEEWNVRQNLSGQPGAALLWDDPGVEAAVIEMPRKALLRFGHAADAYDVAALLNVQDDHIGEHGIVSLEAMAALKGSVLRRARKAVVLNAEDARCLAVRDQVSAPRQLLFSRDPDTPALCAHLAGGGEGVSVVNWKDEPTLCLLAGDVVTPLLPVTQLAAAAEPHLGNALAVAALAHAQGLSLKVIAAGLATFGDALGDNPGRYEWLDVGQPFSLLLDYAHNLDGLRSLCQRVQQLPCTGQRHVVAANVGNRQRRYLDAALPWLASTFDHFVLSASPPRVLQAPDYQGDDPLGNMLTAFAEGLSAQGVAPTHLQVQRERDAAILAGLNSVGPNDLLVLLTDPWETYTALRAWRGHENACDELPELVGH